MTTYRKHENSISNSESALTIYSKHQLLYAIMKKHFGIKYHLIINEALYVHLKGTMLLLSHQGVSFRRYLPEFIRLWISLGNALSFKGLKEFAYFIIKLR